MATLKLNISSNNGNTQRTPEQIKAIQTQLNGAGAGLAVDGIWGPKTEAAYNAYNAFNSSYVPASTTPAEVVPPKTRQDVLKDMPGYTGTNEYGLPSMPNVDIGAAYDDSISKYKEALDAAYNSTKAETEAQLAKRAQAAAAQRGQIYANSRLSAIGNNERMAALGLAGNVYDPARSGFSETSRVMQDVGMRNDINAVTNQLEADKAELALNLIKAGYTRDADYAAYLASALIDKANAQEAQAQNRFQNELTMYQLAQAAADEWNALNNAGIGGGYNGGAYRASVSTNKTSGNTGSPSTPNPTGGGGLTKNEIIVQHVNGETNPNTAAAQAMQAYSSGTINSADLNEILNLVNYKSNVDKAADRLEQKGPGKGMGANS